MVPHAQTQPESFSREVEGSNFQDSVKFIYKRTYSKYFLLKLKKSIWYLCSVDVCNMVVSVGLGFWFALKLN